MNAWHPARFAYLGIFVAGLFFSACGYAGQDPAGSEAGAFVQGFYINYQSQSDERDHRSKLERAIQNQRADFGQDLLQLLIDDVDAQSRAEGDIVGLDFDPFLSGQDDVQRCHVSGAVKGSKGYTIPVSCGNSNATRIYVDFRDGKWLIENIYYKDGLDLIELLKRLKASRESDSNN